MEKVEKEERVRLGSTLNKLTRALERARKLESSTTGNSQDMLSYVAEYRGELDSSDKQIMKQAIASSDMQAGVAQMSVKRLEKQIGSPYFARVDFVPGDDPDNPLTAYIGQFAFIWEGQTEISDWRSPVASLFYNYESGPAAYEAPTGPQEGVLALKRQLSIEGGELVYAVDSDAVVRDEVLQHELSKSSSGQMRTIISSIQKEQNDLIRDDANGTLVIQGVAGSGKTSIALHRVAYLLYARRDELDSSSVVILSPNRVFGDYIAGVLPELGEDPVSEYTLYDLACRQVGKVAKVEPPRAFADNEDAGHLERVAFKSAPSFASDLIAFAEGAYGWIFEPGDLSLAGALISAEWLDERWKSYSGTSVGERLGLTALDVRARAKAETRGMAGDALPSAREVQKKLERMLLAKTPVALYKRFLKGLGAQAMFRQPAAGAVEWEDACPLLILDAVLTGGEEFRDVKHLVIDEMQDLTPVQHAAIERLFPCQKTILGDVNQLVDGHEATPLAEVAALHNAARVAKLMRSYRSTFEICMLANAVRPVEGIIPVERHGEAPRIECCANTQDVVAKLGEAIGAFRANGGKTMGIICKSDKLAALYGNVLSYEHGVNVLDESSSTFDEGITVCSVKMAKGLEFDDVAVLDADANQYATSADRDLLYVAITRAMHRLTILYRGKPSPFLPAPQ